MQAIALLSYIATIALAVLAVVLPPEIDPSVPFQLITINP
jgi:hypothetical protein